MADHCSLRLLGVMDRLWFHQIILLSESSSTLLLPTTLKQQSPFITSSLVNLPSTLSFSTSADQQQEQETCSISGPTPRAAQLNELNLNDHKREPKHKVAISEKERPTRLNFSTNRARSHSSSPSTAKRLTKSRGMRRVLQKSMSCRSLGELELDEVKGFMDLGFIFKKEEISPRMISVVPGLLRLGFCIQEHETKLIDEHHSHVGNDDEVVGEEREGIRRPYLSEAWLIRRPDSPLLNLRLPRASAAADMKKHLKFWARTVAYEIQQEY